MTRACFALVALALSAAAAAAQPVPPGGGAASRPTVSPYLGLLGGSRSPGLNYLAFVRPQLQLQQQFNQLQQQQQQYNNGVQQELNGLALGGDPFLPQTGVVARFNSLGSYYGRHPVAGAGNLRGFGSGGGGGSSYGGGRSFGSAGLGASSFGGASGFSGGARSGGRSGGVTPRATGGAGVGGVRR